MFLISSAELYSFTDVSVHELHLHFCYFFVIFFFIYIYIELWPYNTITHQKSFVTINILSFLKKYCMPFSTIPACVRCYKTQQTVINSNIINLFFLSPFQTYTPRTMPAASPNTSGSQSSGGSQSGEQLSKTNLYIRGLNPNTTDKNLVDLCQP